MVPRTIIGTPKCLRKFDKGINVILAKWQVWEAELMTTNHNAAQLCKVIETGFCQITGQNFLEQFDRLVSEYVNQWVVLDLCGHSQRTSDKVNLTKGDFLFL